MRFLAGLTLALVLCAVAAPAATAAVVQQAPRTCVAQVGTFVMTINHGEVGWVSDGGSSANFSDCPIPAGTFGSGSDPLGNQEIALDGVALSGQTGAIDTLVEVDRLSCLSEGQTKTTGTRIRGMHMEGSAVITFNGGGNPQVWDLDVYAAGNQNSGTMSITLEDDFGGTYTSSLPVVARLVFTRGASQVVIEDPACEIHFDSASRPWSVAAPGKFDPAAQGLPPLPAGVSIDGNGDGTPDYVTAGRTNFIPGVEYTGSGSGLTALSSEGLETTVTTTTGGTISPWKWWLIRELYLLFKHLIWIKPINPFIDVADEFPVGNAREVETEVR